MKAHVYSPAFSPEQNAWLHRMNFDESKAGPYTLPDPLRCEDGSAVATHEAWFEKRRPELRSLFEQYVYGSMLPAIPFRAEVTEESSTALDGLATRRQVTLSFPDVESTRGEMAPRLHLVLYIPNSATAQAPAPCFLGLSFYGNEASFDDPAIPVSQAWMREGAPGVVDHRATEASRGTGTSRWPLQTILQRGYAAATLYYGDIEPDHPGGIDQSIRAYFQQAGVAQLPHEAGAITAWAWGLSRVLDYLLTEPRLDAKRIGVTGHSRLGKTALWAAACDERFAFAISNNSGCGGASLSNRNFGETLHILSNVRQYWFSPRCRTASADMAQFPVDQHLLVAQIAPRPVFISSASNDHAADPLGEYRCAVEAGKVYRFLGFEDSGPCSPEPPPINTPLYSRVGYELREGEHNITPHDWQTHLDFVDRHLSPHSAGDRNTAPLSRDKR